MKHHVTVQQVVDHFAGIGELFFPTDRPYIYAEVGRYKLFHGATIAALRKRGYRVEPCVNKLLINGVVVNRPVEDVYFIHNKEAV